MSIALIVKNFISFLRNNLSKAIKMKIHPSNSDNPITSQKIMLNELI